MAFLSKKLDSFVGVDIGGHSVKVVELYNYKGRAKLRTYGIAEIEMSLDKKEPDEKAEEIAKVVKKLCKKAKVTSDTVVTALPTFDVFSSIINIPDVPKKELPAAVTWEAKKFIPLPLEEMTLDWQILDIEKAKIEKVDDEGLAEVGEKVKIKKKEEKHLKILLTAAPKSLVYKYANIFKHAGMSLLSLETETFAMIRSLVGNDKSLVMVIDVGAVNTNISVVDQGIPIINRGVDSGGLNVNKVLKRVMGISESNAEQFKRDLANYMIINDVHKPITKDFELAVAPIINEIKYIYSLFVNQAGDITLSGDPNAKIERIILTGGSSVLPYFSDYLMKEFDTKVYVGDPWARVMYPEDLKFVLEDTGPKLAIAIGLAMREIS